MEDFYISFEQVLYLLANVLEILAFYSYFTLEGSDRKFYTLLQISRTTFITFFIPCDGVYCGSQKKFLYNGDF